MSKRYGRNQKRQARERIASLEEAYNRERVLLEWQGEKLREYEYWSRELDQLVPRYSILKKDLQSKTYLRAPQPTEYLAEMKPLPPISADASMEMFNSPVERLRMNVMEIEARPEDFRRGMRYQIRLNNPDDARVFYAVDDEMLELTGFDRHEVEWMSREIARNMAGHINEKYRR